MKILYLDCFNGISGDMTIGALLDAGGSFSYLQDEIKKLSLDDEYELQVHQVVKNGITATKFDCIVKHEEIYEHKFVNRKKSHHHHRSYQDIVQIIQNSGLSEKVKNLSLRIFKKIGEVEAKIHNEPLEKVHFHEIGAVDSIVDIVGTAILIEQLEIDEVYASPIPVGSGEIHIAHGIYPVPAPATLEILRGVPIKESNIEAELTTPTGAAIAVELARQFGPLPAMTVRQIGYGAGMKTFPSRPNVLRVIIGEQV